MPQFHEGGAAMYNALVYARPHENTIQFLAGQANQYYERLTDAARQYSDQAAAFYDRIGLSWSSNQLRALARQVESAWQNDEVRVISSLQQFQQAPAELRRWIMAEPTVRQLYHENRVEGYDQLYTDPYPGMVGHNHYDYRQAVSGVMMEDDNARWGARTYYEDPLGPGSMLTALDKMELQVVWKNLRAQLSDPVADPTSIYGDERG